MLASLDRTNRGGRPAWAPALALALATSALLCGCPADLAQVCPRCEVLAPGRGRLRAVTPGTERLYVLVPGILGYGWEWNGVQIALSQVPRSQVLVVEWEPWRSLWAGGQRTGRAVQALLDRAPDSVREVVLIGHSVGGLVATLAVAGLRVPPGLLRRGGVRALVIGAPFGGMHADLVEYPEPLHAPSLFALGGTFRTWPPPAPGVTLEVYPTSWPSDPVMKPRYGHDPGALSALPPGAQLRTLPRGIDHNVATTWVAEHLAGEARGSESSTAAASR